MGRHSISTIKLHLHITDNSLQAHQVTTEGLEPLGQLVMLVLKAPMGAPGLLETMGDKETRAGMERTGQRDPAGTLEPRDPREVTETTGHLEQMEDQVRDSLIALH